MLSSASPLLCLRSPHECRVLGLQKYTEIMFVREAIYLNHWHLFAQNHNLEDEDRGPNILAFVELFLMGIFKYNKSSCTYHLGLPRWH